MSWLTCCKSFNYSNYFKASKWFSPLYNFGTLGDSLDDTVVFWILAYFLPIYRKRLKILILWNLLQALNLITFAIDFHWSRKNDQIEPLWDGLKKVVACGQKMKRDDCQLQRSMWNLPSRLKFQWFKETQRSFFPWGTFWLTFDR